MGEAAAFATTTIMDADAEDVTISPSVFFANIPFNLLRVDVMTKYIQTYGDTPEHPAIILFRALVILDISVIAKQTYGDCVKKFIEYLHQANFSRDVFSNSNWTHIFEFSYVNINQTSRLERFCKTLNILLTPEKKIELKQSISTFVSTCSLYYRRLYEDNPDILRDTLVVLNSVIYIPEPTQPAIGNQQIPRSVSKTPREGVVVSRTKNYAHCRHELYQGRCYSKVAGHRSKFAHIQPDGKWNVENPDKGGSIGKRRIVTKKRNIRSRMNRRTGRSTTARRRH